jgi:hypothetical protein
MMMDGFARDFRDLAVDHAFREQFCTALECSRTFCAPILMTALHA